jgi:hypothetical protein
MVVLCFDVSFSFNRPLDPIFVIHFLFFISCWNRVRLLSILFCMLLNESFLWAFAFQFFYLVSYCCSFLVFDVFYFHI